MRDRLDGPWAGEDFAGWYPRDGRPGISPAQLATVSVLQFPLDLSDRDAAEAVRCRIDSKYGLGLDLNDPSFHYSVLGGFRDQLLEDGLVRERTAGHALEGLAGDDWAAATAARPGWARTPPGLRQAPARAQR